MLSEYELIELQKFQDRLELPIKPNSETCPLIDCECGCHDLEYSLDEKFNLYFQKVNELIEEYRKLTPIVSNSSLRL